MRMQLVLFSNRNNIIDQPSKSFNLVTKLGEPHTVEKSFACIGGSLMIIADVLEALATLYDLDCMQPIYNYMYTQCHSHVSAVRLFWWWKVNIRTTHIPSQTISCHQLPKPIENLWTSLDFGVVPVIFWHFFLSWKITLPAALHWCRLQVFWTPATCSIAWQPREPQEQAMQKQSAP